MPLELNKRVRFIQAKDNNRHLDKEWSRLIYDKRASDVSSFVFLVPPYINSVNYPGLDRCPRISGASSNHPYILSVTRAEVGKFRCGSLVTLWAYDLFCLSKAHEERCSSKLLPQGQRYYWQLVLSMGQTKKKKRERKERHTGSKASCNATLSCPVIKSRPRPLWNTTPSNVATQALC